MVEKWLKKWLVVGVHAQKQLFLVILGLFLPQNDHIWCYFSKKTSYFSEKVLVVVKKGTSGVHEEGT